MGDIGSDKVQEVILDTLDNTLHKIKMFFKKKKKKDKGDDKEKS